jgi:hypothetical protein
MVVAAANQDKGRTEADGQRKGAHLRGSGGRPRRLSLPGPPRPGGFPPPQSRRNFHAACSPRGLRHLDVCFALRCHCHDTRWVAPHSGTSATTPPEPPFSTTDNTNSTNVEASWLFFIRALRVICGKTQVFPPRFSGFSSPQLRYLPIRSALVPCDNKPVPTRTSRRVCSPQPNGGRALVNGNSAT